MKKMHEVVLASKTFLNNLCVPESATVLKLQTWLQIFDDDDQL